MKKILTLLAAIVFSYSNHPSIAAEVWNPQADPAAMVVSGQARFTVLTPALVRLEWSSTGAFEDRASLTFVNRRLPVPKFTSDRDGGELVLRTGELTLRYREGSGRFKAENLSVELGTGGEAVTWRPGMADSGNLRGTTRTLDGVSGACPLEPGLLSRDGWTVVDDSPRPLLDGKTPQWVTGRPEGERQDLYFFGYGRDYKRQLGDYVKVAGRIPLPPKFAFGAWWSRYWAYTADELKELVNDFEANETPLDVLVIDIDWHLDGWTGYTWNPKYFPDPQGFLDWVHDHGLKVTLNLHPHEGVRVHEAAFPDFARGMGLDPSGVKQIPFDCADPRYMDLYFKLLHHPLEKQGVDFWWMDWQQGAKTRVEGLDPLFWLNHLHWNDMLENPSRQGARPLIFSRWGGLGSHRYEIGFSGDTFCNWPSLAFQPAFTATASNVGFGYWSHDIGGHQPGMVAPELYARWVQFGALSPALRTHTTKNEAAERRIWKFPPRYFHIMRDAFNFRYGLLPYLYTAARQAYDTGVSMCRPLYYAWPQLDEAYAHGDSYMLGDDLLVRPVAQAVNPLTQTATVRVWLPPGDWVSLYTGEEFHGPQEIDVAAPLEETPMFARAGAIIPRRQPAQRIAKLGDPLILDVIPGERGETRVYDDEGTSLAYQTDGAAWVTVTNRESSPGGAARLITIGASEGRFVGIPTTRHFEVHLLDVWPAEKVLVNGFELARRPEGKPGADGWWYDPRTFSVIVPVAAALGEPREVSVRWAASRRERSVLAAGLRGRLAAIDALAVRLDEMGAEHISPETQANVERWRSGLLSRSEWSDFDPADVENIINADLRGLISAADQLGVVEMEREKLLASLLRLSFDVRAKGAADGGVDLAATVGISPLGAVVAASNAELSIAQPPNWTVAGENSWKLDEIGPGHPAHVRPHLVPATEAQTTGLFARLMLTTSKGPQQVRVQQVLLPSIGRWWILGPFDAPQKDRLATVFPPEEKIDLEATYKGKDGKDIRWQRVERSLDSAADLMDEFFVEFHKVFGGEVQNAVAYALVYVEVAEAMEAQLAIGSDDGFVAWVNGKEVGRKDVGRAYTSRQDTVPIVLQRGKNSLLVKISQGGGMWGFGVHLEDRRGRPTVYPTTTLTP